MKRTIPCLLAASLVAIRRPLAMAFCVHCVLAGVALAQPPRLDRYNLLLYRAADGKVQNVHSKQDLHHRRNEVLKAMQTVMGELPNSGRAVDLGVKVEEEVDKGSYIRRLISYQSEPNSRTPAYLCIPKAALDRSFKAPAVLCLHPTNNQVGHKVVMGIKHQPWQLYGAELAERGYVVIAPSYPHLANYWPNLGKLGYVSGTMKAIWDNKRALDVLESLPQIDTTRGFGAIGHSLGGHNAIYTALFDDRIQAIVTSCGFDSYSDYYDGNNEMWYFGKGWCQIRYMPRLSNYRGRLQDIPFDFPEMLGMLAPRAVFINAPKGDGNFRWQSVARCVAAAEDAYRLLEQPGNLVVQHPECGHDFPQATRNAAYEFLDEKLLTGRH